MAGRLAEIRRVAVRRVFAAGVASRFGLAPPRVRREAMAEQLRKGLEELGPTFVKLGQIGSVRADVFGSETLAQLDRLRDDVAPVQTSAISEVIVRSFARAPETLFEGFEPVALASASIAQVHRARLPEDYTPVFGETLRAGTDLAIKVVRPGAREIVRADVDAARRVVRRLPRVGPLRRIDLPSLVDELEASLERELDMRIEGRTADRFAFDFRHDPLVQVPRVVWPLTSRDVLTMEFVEGWPLTRLGEAEAVGVDTHALAEHGAEAFMRQVLMSGRFHADLHHANLLITPAGRIAYLDFGMVGHLDARDRASVAHLLTALVYRDPDQALRWTAALGVDIPREKAIALSADLGRLMDHTLDSRGGSDMRDFGIGLLTLLRQYDVAIASGYGLLVKALVTVEGVSRRLYPDIDMMAMAAPFVTRLLLQDALRPEALARRAPAAARAALAELLRDD
jgi:ubiquinone biosynthesis protein